MRFMLLLMSATIGAALECYRGSNLLQELPIHSKTCLENPIYQSRWCIKITNWSNVVRSCDELKICSMQGNRCVNNMKYGQLRGELCCCDSDYCNAVSQLAISLATVLVVGIIVLCIYRGAIAHYSQTNFPEIFFGNPQRDRTTVNIYLRYETTRSLERQYPDENKENIPPR